MEGREFQNSGFRASDDSIDGAQTRIIMEACVGVHSRTNRGDAGVSSPRGRRSRFAAAKRDQNVPSRGAVSCALRLLIGCVRLGDAEMWANRRSRAALTTYPRLQPPLQSTGRSDATRQKSARIAARTRLCTTSTSGCQAHLFGCTQVHWMRRSHRSALASAARLLLTDPARRLSS